MINGITATTLSNEGFQPKQESVHALLYNKNELHLAVDIVLLVVFAKKCKLLYKICSNFKVSRIKCLQIHK